ncbi:forkhead associated domain-containing protein [Cryptosporidium canis]|uniref:Forkhead associated domain-containing protein n=1 Tax=Cryptosporidium canis TaxID=195482 RepID=A0A9D5DJE9_9CRYT|nr:forkhead associated domain-containing protein [Cryptosporidium canis]
MYWWLNPISPCCDPSLSEPVKLPFGEEDELGDSISGLENNKFVFGRKGDCSIRLKDQSISGHHCTIHVDTATKGLVITDTSTNGTFLNGKRLSKSVPVQVTDGDIISLTRPKVMDDNIAFHAIFRLVFSSKSPRLTEGESLASAADININDSILESKGGKMVELSNNDISVEDSLGSRSNEKQSEENLSGRKESVCATNSERKSTRSSMSLRSQERKGRFSAKDEGRADEPVARRSRGRPRTIDRLEMEEIINIEEDQTKTDKEIVEFEKSIENENELDKQKEKELDGRESTNESKCETLKDEKRGDEGDSVKLITDVERLSEKHLSVESISQLFEVGTNEAFQQGKENRSSIISQKLSLADNRGVDKNPSIGSSLTFSAQKQQTDSTKRSRDELLDKLENLELLVSRKESLERTLKSEIEAREEEISRLREMLDRSEINERQIQQHNMALMEELQNAQRQNLDLEHELMDFQERCRVLSASGEAMDQTINQLSEDLSAARQELLSLNDRYNQQSLALKSVTQLTQRKCLSILHSLKDIHQLSSTYISAGTGNSSGGSILGTSGVVLSNPGSVLTPWRSGKRSFSTSYGYNGNVGVPQTERPYKMRSSPIGSSRNNAAGVGDASLSRRSSFSGGNSYSLSEDFDVARNGILGGSISQCLPSNRFLSGSSQLEEQLVSSLKANSLEIQNVGINLNKNIDEHIQVDDEPKSYKTVNHDSDDKHISLSQQLVGSALDKIPTALKTRKSNVSEASSTSEALMNKENSISNI